MRFHLNRFLWFLCFILGAYIVDLACGTTDSWISLPLYILAGGLSAIFVGPILEFKKDDRT